MNNINWKEILNWGEEEIENLRFVGFAYLKQGKYDIALTFFEALVILSPTNAYDLQTLGALHLQTGNNKEALTYLNKSLKIEPHHFPSLLNRAKALFALGYKKQSLQEIYKLEHCEDQNIAVQASALLLLYSQPPLSP